jgi:hypothetical protein
MKLDVNIINLVREVHSFQNNCVTYIDQRKANIKYIVSIIFLFSDSFNKCHILLKASFINMFFFAQILNK